MRWMSQKHLRRISNKVLVYAEIFDDRRDDPSTMFTKLIFEREDQPSGAFLGLQDRTH